MRTVYFIDANAAAKGTIGGLRDTLKIGDEVHIFGGVLPNRQKAEIKKIESNVTLHVAPVTQRQRVDFELIALYAMYTAAEANNKQMYVISKNTQLLKTIEEMRSISCN